MGENKPQNGVLGRLYKMQDKLLMLCCLGFAPSQVDFCIQVYIFLIITNRKTILDKQKLFKRNVPSINLIRIKLSIKSSS